MSGTCQMNLTHFSFIPYFDERLKGISVQEAVWGTKLLKELEKIKTAVDRKSLLSLSSFSARD